MSIDSITQELALTLPWIAQNGRRIESLRTLLEEAEQAAAVHGPALIAKLLGRFTFLSVDQYEELVLEMANFINETFDLATTLLCATTADRYKDSAQRVLYDLVSTLAGIGRYKVRSVNRYEAVTKEGSCEDVIFIDEFIGSGQSFSGRARRLRQLFTQKGRQAPAIHGIALAGMTRGLRDIQAHFDSLNVCVALKMGIRDRSEPSVRCQEYSVMSDIEALLAPVYDAESLPSLGYSGSEALYARHGGSCPNNVFPVFWWPHRIGGIDRRPMFPRAL